jgi:hypothetical protein
MLLKATQTIKNNIVDCFKKNCFPSNSGIYLLLTPEDIEPKRKESFANEIMKTSKYCSFMIVLTSVLLQIESFYSSVALRVTRPTTITPITFSTRFLTLNSVSQETNDETKSGYSSEAMEAARLCAASGDDSSLESILPSTASTSKGFGKIIRSGISRADETVKGKRSEAKKKYQQERKLEKNKPSLGKMMGSDGTSSSDMKFKNSSYI